MTSGEQLKQELGLYHLKYVSFTRLIGTGVRMIIIFYSSTKPNVPLTTQRVLNQSLMFTSQRYPFRDVLPTTPLIPIEEYGGNLRNTIFLTFDLAGTLGKSKFQVRENQSKTLYSLAYFGKGSFIEAVTLSDLSSTSAISDFTKNTRSQRNSALKPENQLAKLVDVQIDTVEDHVTFIFKTTATKPIYPKDYKFKKSDPDKKHKLVRNPEKEYEMYIRVLGFLEWLKDTRPDDDTSDISETEVKDAMKVSNIQVYSTSPSYHWQGINFWLSQLDGSIYPTDIAPKKWNASHLHGNDGAFLDKHLYGLIRSWKFFLNPMASKLTKRLRDRGII